MVLLSHQIFTDTPTSTEQDDLVFKVDDGSITLHTQSNGSVDSDKAGMYSKDRSIVLQTTST